MTAAQEVSTCDGCGACCLHVGTPPGFALWFPPPGIHVNTTADVRRNNSDSFIVAKMPPEVVQSLKDGFKEAWETDRSGQQVPCFWWDSATRRCKYHAYRPHVCRDFEVGGEDCGRLRKRYGITISARGAKS